MPSSAARREIIEPTLKASDSEPGGVGYASPKRRAPEGRHNYVHLFPQQHPNLARRPRDELASRDKVGRQK
jgi:hypothetical protein